MENFENYCGEFRGIFPKILRIISKNIENHFKKISDKISEDFEKYFGNFREVFQNIL